MEKIHIEPNNSTDTLKGLKNDAQKKSGLKKSNPFNKLAQLDHRKDESLVISGVKHQLNLGKKSCISKSKAPYRAKAQSKAFTDAYLPQLRALHSPLANGYDRTAMCTHTMTQRGSKVTSEYCKQRWCNGCSRIMTAHLMNGYGQELSEFKNPQFLTLTIPNVGGKSLRTSIENMVLSFIKIKRRIERRNEIKIKGIRKIESTFSPQRRDFHPHFHLIIEGKENAEMLLKEWLIDNPKASIKGQNIKEANTKSMNELFKYFAKMVNGSTFYAKAMDTIFQSVRGKRVVQSFGMKKQVDEDYIDIKAQDQIHLGIKDDKFTYIADYKDWVSESGEVLADYTETESIKRYNKEVSESSKRLNLGIKERVRLNWGQYPTIEPISNLIF